MTVELFRRRAAAPVTDVRNVLFVIAALVILGAAAGVRATAASHAYPEVAASTLVLFAASLIIAAMPIVRVRHGSDRASVDLFEAILVPAIFVLRPDVLVPIVAGAVLVANLVGRNAPLKTLFNAVQWAAAAAIGSLVYVSFDPSSILAGRTILALIAATIAASLVNEMAVATVVRINAGPAAHADRSPPLSSLVERVTGWTFNATFGLLFVTAYLWEPAGLVLFVVPLVVLGAAYRQYAAAQAERLRFEGVRRALRALEDQPEVGPFLVEVRRSFVARTVELHLRDRDQLVRYRATLADGADVDQTTAPWSPESASARLFAVMDHAGIVPASLGWGDAIAAPLSDGSRMLGVLVVAERTGLEGFDDAEVTLLEALAAEAAGRAVSSALARAVARERERLREIVDRASDAGFALDRSGAVIVWNEGMERLTGCRRADVLGKPLPATLTLRDELDRAVPLGWWIDDETQLPDEIAVTAATGERRWLSCTYTRVPGDEGGPVMLMVVARDITEPREASRISEAFAGTVAHELRTPLTPIRGWAETLALHDHRLKRSERRDIARRIAEQAQHLEVLITRLLEMAKPDPPGVRASRARVADVVARVVADHRDAASGRIIELEVSDELLVAHGDPVWIERIVSNLVSNALKYSPQDAPVEVEVCRTGAGCVGVLVSDRGPGVPPEHQQRIFDLYARLEQTKGSEGTGLGLYISRQLARAMDAQLTVTDRPGGGSTFVLTLRPEGGASS